MVQFCGHDPEILLASAKFVENDCDAIDLNLVSVKRVFSLPNDLHVNLGHSEQHPGRIALHRLGTNCLRIFSVRVHGVFT